MNRDGLIVTIQSVIKMIISNCSHSPDQWMQQNEIWIGNHGRLFGNHPQKSYATVPQYEAMWLAYVNTQKATPVQQTSSNKSIIHIGNIYIQPTEILASVANMWLRYFCHIYITLNTVIGLLNTCQAWPGNIACQPYYVWWGTVPMSLYNQKFFWCFFLVI